jgi:hypothetical protein
VSRSVIRKLLKKHGYHHRKAQKKQTLKSVLWRDEQFHKIAAPLAEYRVAGNPIISFDTKKKEYLGISIATDAYIPKQWSKSMTTTSPVWPVA